MGKTTEIRVVLNVGGRNKVQFDHLFNFFRVDIKMVRGDTFYGQTYFNNIHSALVESFSLDSDDVVWMSTIIKEDTEYVVYFYVKRVGLVSARPSCY